MAIVRDEFGLFEVMKERAVKRRSCPVTWEVSLSDEPNELCPLAEVHRALDVTREANSVAPR